MERDDQALLGHILTTARSILAETADISLERFEKDDVLRDALAYRFQVIGEAASQVSRAFRAKHPEVPWARIVGMRHRIVHDYMNVNYKILWRTAKEDIPVLIEHMQTLVQEGNSPK
ncbi:MAG: hypothetical protein AMXMBFR82_27480 [Candidatus Hydrogenedentota bacterium]